jgi:hypothetical protein
MAVTPSLGVGGSHPLFLPAGSRRHVDGLGVTFGLARPTVTDERF